MVHPGIRKLSPVKLSADFTPDDPPPSPDIFEKQGGVIWRFSFDDDAQDLLSFILSQNNHIDIASSSLILLTTIRTQCKLCTSTRITL